MKSKDIHERVLEFSLVDINRTLIEYEHLKEDHVSNKNLKKDQLKKKDII